MLQVLWEVQVDLRRDLQWAKLLRCRNRPLVDWLLLEGERLWYTRLQGTDLRGVICSFSIKQRKISNREGFNSGILAGGGGRAIPARNTNCAFMCESALWPKAKDNFRRFSSIINGYVLVLLVFNNPFLRCRRRAWDLRFYLCCQSIGMFAR